MAELHAGDPFDPATTLAPLSSQEAADDLKDKIRQAMAQGATATEVGPKVPNQGAFVQPTILTNVTEGNPARYWEFFGPVRCCFARRMRRMRFVSQMTLPSDLADLCLRPI